MRRKLTSVLFQQGLPRTGRIFYLKDPNSENQPWNEESEWGEGFPWGSWVLPGSLFADFGEGLFFNGSGVPQDVTGAQILAFAFAPSAPYVVFSAKKTWLAIYAHSTSVTTVNRARKLAGLPPLP
jgi:hypothetical protein